MATTKKNATKKTTAKKNTRKNTKKSVARNAPARSTLGNKVQSRRKGKVPVPVLAPVQEEAPAPAPVQEAPKKSRKVRPPKEEAGVRLANLVKLIGNLDGRVSCWDEHPDLSAHLQDALVLVEHAQEALAQLPDDFKPVRDNRRAMLGVKTARSDDLVEGANVELTELGKKLYALPQGASLTFSSKAESKFLISVTVKGKVLMTLPMAKKHFEVID